MTQRCIFFLTAWMVTGLCNAQLYRVHFMDKGQPGNTVDYDIPVNPDYLKEVESLSDSVYMVSKWLNYALIKSDKFPESIQQLVFVREIEKVVPLNVNYHDLAENKKDSVDPVKADKHRQWQIDTLGYQYFK